MIEKLDTYIRHLFIVRRRHDRQRRQKAEIGIFLTLTEPKKTMVAEAAAAGQFQMEGFEPVPRIQIVSIEEALNLRDRAVRLPARPSR